MKRLKFQTQTLEIQRNYQIESLLHKIWIFRSAEDTNWIEIEVIGYKIIYNNVIAGVPILYLLLHQLLL